jgi:histone-lysine N-methyltransferase SETMAR
VLFGSIDKVTGIVRRKSPELWPEKWILDHDSSPAYDSLRVREFLAKKSITKMDHPTYLPDLAPCDFWIFPKLKMTWRDKDLLTFLTSNAT